MAKKKIATRAAKGSRKEPLRRVPTATSKAPEERANPNAAPGPASVTDQAILDGIASTRVITEAIRPEIDAAVKAAFVDAIKDDFLRSLNSSVAGVLKPLREAIDDLYRKIDELPKPPTQESIHRLAEDRIKQASLQAERRQIWASEWWATDHKNSVRTAPRPSIIGRAMHELQTQNDGKPLTPAAIFQQIQKRGQHHLPETIRELLRKYKKSDGHVDKDVSGKLGTHLRDRLKGLAAGLLVQDEQGKLRLTPRGLTVFSGWPDWSVRSDDVGCQGRADYATGTTASAANGGRSSGHSA